MAAKRKNTTELARAKARILRDKFAMNSIHDAVLIHAEKGTLAETGRADFVGAPWCKSSIDVTASGQIARGIARDYARDIADDKKRRGVAGVVPASRRRPGLASFTWRK